MELYKKSLALKEYKQFYFWRTHQGLEIDILIEKDGKLSAFECKWSRGDSKNLKSFQKVYPNAEINLVSQENYLDYIT